MTKLRSNHSDQSKQGSGTMAKVGIFGAIVGGLYFFFSFFTGTELPPASDENPSEYVGEEHFLPSEIRGSDVYYYKNYALSYNNDFEQADWVAYVLEADNLSKPWNDRNDNFRSDPVIKGGSADIGDYRGSGYDRGHLVPAADMAYDAVAMDETFLLSNITPQSRNFNQGIWRELEELTRNWAKKFKRIYVVSGPILTEEPKGYIGRNNEVAVPSAYFKVLLDLDDPEQKAIGFILPNEVSYEPLYKYATTIDEVETLAEIDFFEDFMPKELEEKLEANTNIDLWPFSKKKHDTRVGKWNK